MSRFWSFCYSRSNTEKDPIWERQEDMTDGDNLYMRATLALHGASFDDKERVMLSNGALIIPIDWGMGMHSASVRLPGPKLVGWTMAGPMVSRGEAIRRAVAEVMYIAPDGRQLRQKERDESRKPPHMDLPSIIRTTAFPPGERRDDDEPHYLVWRHGLGRWSCILMFEHNAYFGYRTFHFTKRAAKRRGERWLASWE